MKSVYLLVGGIIAAINRYITHPFRKLVYRVEAEKREPWSIHPLGPAGVSRIDDYCEMKRRMELEIARAFAVPDNYLHRTRS